MSAALDESSLAARIARRAASRAIELEPDDALALARHMLRVLAADPALHLTAIRDPALFLDRHVGESLEGASLVDPARHGAMLDLGSGNGYPGLVVAACRRGLAPFLGEASKRKAAFLRTLLAPDFPGGAVVERQIQRASDLADYPEFVVMLCRGTGNWERVLPRLASRLAPDGRLLVWAGESMEQVARRTVWRRFRLLRRHALRGRERSWIWCFSTKTDP